MESVNLDMGEIFDEGGGDDDDIGAVGTLPDLPEGTQDQDNEEDNTEVLQRLKDLSKGAAKKVIRRPQPKLDPTRLTGDRGIPILPKMFEKVKFKGKGHEAQDLSVIMRYMEHWAHRLFPKMPFDEVVERVEKLGSKKEVQTCVKKMRLGMPVLGDEFVGSDHEEDEDKDDDDVQRGGEPGDNPGGGKERREAELDNLWEDLLKEEDELRASQVQATPKAPPPDVPAVVSSQPVASGSGVHSTPITPAQKLSTESPGLTPEQVARMEKNKQMARERQLRKLGIFSPVPVQATPAASAASQSSSQSTSDKTTVSLSTSDKTIVSQSTSEKISGAQSSQNSGENSSSQGLTGTQSTSGKTTVSQSSQNHAENSSSQCPSGTLSNGGNELETQSDKNGSGNVVSQTQGGETFEDEMSEVIDKGTSQNVVLDNLQMENDAQHPCTLNSNDADSDVSEMDLVDSTKETMESTEDKDAHIQADDSEEMSVVIEKQDNEGVKSLKQSQDSLVNGTNDSNGANVDSMEEMSAVIEKQDVVTKVVDATGDADEDKENMADKTNETNTGKHKLIADNLTKEKSKEKVLEMDDEFNDDLNEEELMDILDE